MRQFWIAHPAADGAPVSLWRWLRWQYAEWLYSIICRLQRHQRRAEHRALYPSQPFDDLPF